MNVHKGTNNDSFNAARDHARDLWGKVLHREATITSQVWAEVDAQPKQHEAINNERSPARRIALIRTLIGQRLAGDKKIKDLTAEYDRTVATATMYGVARLAELMGNDVVFKDE